VFKSGGNKREKGISFLLRGLAGTALFSYGARGAEYKSCGQM